MIRFIIIALVAIAVIRYILKLVTPQGASANRGPNNVTMQYDKEKAKSKTPDDVGEYVEFEEVEDSSK